MMSPVSPSLLSFFLLLSPCASLCFGPRDRQAVRGWRNFCSLFFPNLSETRELAMVFTPSCATSSRLPLPLPDSSTRSEFLLATQNQNVSRCEQINPQSLIRHSVKQIQTTQQTIHTMATSSTHGTVQVCIHTLSICCCKFTSCNAKALSVLRLRTSSMIASSRFCCYCCVFVLFMTLRNASVFRKVQTAHQ